MNKATGIATFIFGAAVGSVATWFFTKKYYAQIAQEEIDSVKEVFSKKVNAEPVESEKRDLTIEEIRNHDYSDVLNKCGYSPEEKEVKPVKEERPPVYEEEPYVIEPDEFGTMFEYDQIELTYYEGDGVLTDDWNHPIKNPDKLVGPDFVEHFGDYEDESDVVYVRNDKKKAEYAIYSDERKSTEVIIYSDDGVEKEWEKTD